MKKILISALSVVIAILSFNQNAHAQIKYDASGLTIGIRHLILFIQLLLLQTGFISRFPVVGFSNWIVLRRLPVLPVMETRLYFTIRKKENSTVFRSIRS